MTHSANYMTIVEPVLEVTFVGEADADPWQTLLTGEGLRLAQDHDAAQVIVSAVSARFRGFSFCELSFSVRLDDDSIFMAQAYNSRRLFAFVERVLFRTPYDDGRIAVAERRIAWWGWSGAAFEATLPTEAPRLRSGPEVDEWAIWLPRRLRKQADVPHMFHARLEGETDHYEADGVRLSLPATTQDGVFRLLERSHFRPRDWLVRPAACHSKSKTESGSAGPRP